MSLSYSCKNDPGVFTWKATFELLNSRNSLGEKCMHETGFGTLFSPPCVSCVLSMTCMSSTWAVNKWWEYAASFVLCVCCDCFSCYAICFWFKYLMTLIKQHLNFLWDPVSVPLDHIMSNNGWNELQWRDCSSVAGSAAVCHGSRTRQLNCSHPVSGILPMKWCIKQYYWYGMFYFYIVFRFIPGMFWSLDFVLLLLIQKTKLKGGIGKMNEITSKRPL